VSLPSAIVTIDVDPFIQLGPVEIAWHGLMTAVGIVVAAFVAMRYARGRGLDPEPVYGAVLWAVLAGMAGARVLFLVENDAGALLEPGEWIGSEGFSVYGGMIAGAAAAGLYFRRHLLGLRYLDALAAGFPLGMAVGRIGDLINGEHYGAVSDLPWALRYVHPAAEVPSGQVAYHPGGLYEIVLALLIAVAVALLYRSLRRPGQLFFLVVGLYAIGRFVMFFYRLDSDPLALGLDTSQWISLAIALASAVGFWLVSREPEDAVRAQSAARAKD
jgi:phosphatidylglycerol---prolipoprotein diacylglyceryl transferase